MFPGFLSLNFSAHNTTPEKFHSLPGCRPPGAAVPACVQAASVPASVLVGCSAARRDVRPNLPSLACPLVSTALHPLSHPRREALWFLWLPGTPHRFHFRDEPQIHVLLPRCREARLSSPPPATRALSTGLPGGCGFPDMLSRLTSLPQGVHHVSKCTLTARVRFLF